MGSDGVLIGRASGAAANANVRWTHLFQDRSSEYSGTLEGVNRAADMYAGLFAASGGLVPSISKSAVSTICATTRDSRAISNRSPSSRM